MTTRQEEHLQGATPTPPGTACACAGVPPQEEQRRLVRACAARHVAALGLLPPLALEELREHGRQVGRQAGLGVEYDDFAALMVGNEVWRKTVAEVPYHRRILLLPQCLRAAGACPAEQDALGLLCRQCGRCCIGPLQARAEELGYVVLVAEGTTVVTQLLQQGRVDAVIGVSCLSVLERAFPHMAAQAIPGLAVPLLRDGCNETELDLQWLLEIMQERAETPVAPGVDVDAIRAQVRRWFEPQALRQLLGEPGTDAERLGQDWLAKAGKRWRPFLTACAYQALSGGDCEAVRGAAVAVECFHKASLIHDDIEDGDARRYGEQTLHEARGIPVALNAGDLLLGEGYRLIGGCGLPPERVVSLLNAASAAHRALCLGQGEELAWARRPVPVSTQAVLEMFRLKTAPAFAVALEMGAICAGSSERECAALRAFSDALGIGYQIRDDLEDLAEERPLHRVPSLLLAIACEQAPDRAAALLADAQPLSEAVTLRWRSLYEETSAGERARQLLRHYRHEAIRALEGAQSAALKGLLRRTVAWILGG